jgi:hypothetical protein
MEYLMSLIFVVPGSIALVRGKGFYLSIVIPRSRLLLVCKVSSIGGLIIYPATSICLVFSDDIAFPAFIIFLLNQTLAFASTSTTPNQDVDIQRFLANQQQVVTLHENSTNQS